MGLYVPLDVNFPDDPKIIRVGLEGAGLYVMALCLAKRLMTDGEVERVHLERFGASERTISDVVDAGLMDDIGHGKLMIRAWLDHNDSAEEVEEKRAKDALRKRKQRRASRENRPNGHAKASERTDADAADASALVEVEEEIERRQQQQARTPAERTTVLDAAVEVLLLRDGTHERAQAKGNPGAWLASAKAGRRTDHLDAAMRALADDPALTAEQLADVLEPPVEAPTVRRPREYEPEPYEPDVDTGKATISDLRGRLHKGDAA